MTAATVKAAISEKIALYDESGIHLEKRVLIVYHVGYISLDYSTDVIINNLKIFRSTVHSHVDSSNVEGLYLFNVLGGEGNPFFKYLPCDAINCVCVQLEHETLDYDTILDFETHKDIVDVLGEPLITKFNNVMFLTFEARGPFDKQTNGEWIRSYTDMLGKPPPQDNLQSQSTPLQHTVDKAHRTKLKLNIGAVTTAISCEPAPRMHIYAFALSSKIVFNLFTFMGSFVTDESYSHNRTAQIGTAITARLLEQGVSIASLVQQARLSPSTKSASGGGTRSEPLPDEFSEHSIPESEADTNEEVAPELVTLDGRRLASTNTRQSQNQDRIGGQSGPKYGSAPLSPHLKAQIGYSVFNDKCLVSQGTLGLTSNPILWCDLQPKEVLFMQYGCSLLKHPGIICEDTIKTFENATIDLNVKNNLKLIQPETVFGGAYKDLYRQFALEDWQWHHSGGFNAHSHHHSSGRKNALVPAEAKTNGEPLVCFLVRSASVHSVKVNVSEAPSRLVKMDIDLLILTLVRQLNPNWKAYFFVTDEKPFEEELQHILRTYDDTRLEYLDVPVAFRPAFTTIDAGYTATDYALGLLMNKPQCRWISLSNADNAYGSSVVQNVLHARDEMMTGEPPYMILAPLDSRNFAEQDYVMRTALRGGKTGGWRERCVGVEASLRVHSFVYTIQTLPLVGRVDLAAVFLDVAKLKRENLFFSNFSDVTRYTCKGCQDGYLTEALVSQRHWSYLQLPIDGLKSMVFHGPSPTLCIASGNVWFDFPEVNKLGCLSHKTIGHLQPAALYDLNRFYDPNSHRVCLRVNQKGYWNRTGSVIT